MDLEGVRRPKTHNGLIAEFSRRYVKTGRIVSGGPNPRKNGGLSGVGGVLRRAS